MLSGLSGDLNFDNSEIGAPKSGGENNFDFSQSFLFLLLIQGFFSGLTIGLLSEGNIKGGIKHSFALMMISFLIASGAGLFFGGGNGDDVPKLILSLIKNGY